MTNTKVTSVVVHPQAVAAMALHAVKHRNSSVHGILLGRKSDDQGISNTDGGVTTIVTDAVGVSHGAPTAVTTETALGLIVSTSSSNNNDNNDERIVGWYTAPMLLEDTRPGPVALRMAANLATTDDDDNKLEPVLLVVQNSVLGQIVTGKQGTANGVVQALGRDFGNQWLEEIKTTVEKPEVAAKAIRQAESAGLVVSNDLLDHYEDTSLPWYPNKDLAQLIKKIE